MSIDINEIIKKLSLSQNLSCEEAEDVMQVLMKGEMPHEDMVSFLRALAKKGETAEELTAMAKVMREFSIKVDASEDVIDTCGTGGSGLPRLNVSTASAFVLGALGVKVAKHGNRGAGGRCGSFDLLEALGAKIELNAGQVVEALLKTGLGFMFAPLYHPAMKHVMPVRKEIGTRTVFNILGPLTNPAGAKRQVLGVSSKEIAPKMIHVLQNLGSKEVMVVHGDDGLDEITLTGITNVWHFKDGAIKEYDITPEQFGFSKAAFDEIKGGDVKYNKEVIEKILRGAITDARRDLVVINSAAGLVVSEKAESLEKGIKMAVKALENGSVAKKLDEYVNFTNHY